MLVAVWRNKLYDIPEVANRLDTVSQYKCTREKYKHRVNGSENQEKYERFIFEVWVGEPACPNSEDASKKLRNKDAASYLAAVFVEKVHFYL